MAIPYSTESELGFNFAQGYTPGSSSGYPYKSDQAPLAAGTIANGTRGTQWVYTLVGVGGITGTGSVVVIDPTNTVTMFSNTAAAALVGNKLGVAPVAAAAGDYVWVQTYGPVDVIAAATGTAANTALTSTATAGQLGTAGTHTITAGGIVLTAVAAANVAPGELNDPAVAT